MALLITRPHTHGDSACLHHMAGYGTRETGYPDFIRITPTDIRISKKSGFNITRKECALFCHPVLCTVFDVNFHHLMETTQASSLHSIPTNDLFC